MLAVVPGGARILVLGDSVMNQFFENLLCGTLRHKAAGVRSRKVWTRNKARWTHGASHRIEYVLWMQESSASPPGCSSPPARGPRPTSIRSATREATFVFHREYKFTELTIKESCTGVDVVVLNYGLHWNSAHTYAGALEELVGYLHKHCSDVHKVFLGTVATHLFTPGGAWPGGDGVKEMQAYLEKAKMTVLLEQFKNNTKSWKLAGCTKHRFGGPHDWRDAMLLPQLRAGFADVRVPPLTARPQCSPVADKNSTIWFVPVGDRMATLFNQHDVDCTHYCMHPHVFDSTHDGLARAMADIFDACDANAPSPAVRASRQALGFTDVEESTEEKGSNFQIPEFRNCSANDVYKC